ncbi:MAG: ABC transporter substrate-binding protein [Treponema sp.]|jgi:putative aldouronate transport system substrate-binding protein|nr:ABC transporter substrate-binding protein [Treponema sp.]
MKKSYSVFMYGMAAVLVFLLTTPVFAGGKQARDSGGALDTSRRVELTMYVLGAEPPKQHELFENFNKMALEKLNCTLKTQYISYSEFWTKYPLIFSSGEIFDMAYAGTWLNFNQLAQRGAFLELDDLWPKYAPKNYAMQSPTAIRQATVTDHLYTIPTLLATYSAYGILYRTDLALPYGWNGRMETFADMENYLEIVKKNNPSIEPLDIYSSGSYMDDIFLYNHGYYYSTGSASNDFLFFDPAQSNPKLMTYYEWDKTPEFLSMMARWNQAGYFSKSALSDTDSLKFRNGKTAAMIHNIDNYESNYRLHPEWNIRYSNYVSDISNLAFTQDALVISRTSRNPERAVALYELITTDEEMFRAFFYGIQGKSYDIETVNGRQYVKALNPQDYEFSSCWASRTRQFFMPEVGAPPDLQQHKDAYDSYIKDGVKSQKFRSFTIDTTSVETEYANCVNVHQQYWWPLELGYVDQVRGLAEYREKMQAAGIDRVRTVIQAQLDAYLAGLK